MMIVVLEWYTWLRGGGGYPSTKVKKFTFSEYKIVRGQKNEMEYKISISDMNWSDLN